MKTYVLASTFLLIIAMPSFAGEEIPDTKANEISVNASFFVKEFLSLNSSSLSTQSPYLLNFKHYFGKAGIRTGIGFDVQNSSDKDLNDFVVKRRFHNIDYRLGVEMKTRLANRWLINYGIDAVFNRNKSTVITDNGFDITTDFVSENGGGLGPFAGITFLISERIRIYTESSVYYIHAETKDETIFENFPEFNLEESGKRDEFKLNLPTSIFFAVTL